MNKYLDYFLKLRCAGDVINAVHPVLKLEKEITEAMAIWRPLKKMVLDEPGKYTVFDLCAGNALTGILSAFTLPINGAVAIDKRERTRPGYGAVKKWNYLFMDIYDYMVFPTTAILISSHPCGELANQIIKLYNESDMVKAMIIIPCCGKSGIAHNYPTLLKQCGCSKYDQWSFHLYQQCTGKVNCYKDNHILSPCNNVIVARKEEK